MRRESLGRVGGSQRCHCPCHLGFEDHIFSIDGVDLGLPLHEHGVDSGEHEQGDKNDQKQGGENGGSLSLFPNKPNTKKTVSFEDSSKTAEENDVLDNFLW